MRELGARGVVALLWYVNVLIHLNRGILSGASERVETFVADALDVAPPRRHHHAHTFYFLLLGSAYEVSALVCSLAGGFLSIKQPPLRLIGAGLAAWLLGATVSALACVTHSFYLLLLGRVLAGVGEAAFQCNAVPFINRHAPNEHNSVCLAGFIASAIVGALVGNAYGAAAATASLTWAYGFHAQIVLMTPAITALVCFVPDHLRAVPSEPFGDMSEVFDVVVDDHNYTVHAPAAKGFVASWWRVLKTRPLALLALGSAAYTFTIGFLQAFVPTLLVGQGHFGSRSTASIVVGVIVLVAGVGGSMFGGLVLDRLTADNSVSPARRGKLAIDVLFYLIAVVVGCGVLMVLATASRAGFLLLFTLTSVLLAAMAPSGSVAAMELFPQSRQAMAIAANEAISYALGTIPSPIVLSWLTDWWAPRCGTVEANGKSKLDPKCFLDETGLRHVLLFCVLWLLWAVVTWASAKFTLLRLDEKHPDEAESPVYVR